jgi:hypothetical protein
VQLFFLKQSNCVRNSFKTKTAAKFAKRFLIEQLNYASKTNQPIG